MLKIPSYTTDEFEPILAQRLQAAMQSRRQKVEWQWEINESLVYDALGGSLEDSKNIHDTLDGVVEDLENKTDQPFAINYVFKYIRYLLSQMAANPPSLVVRAASESVKDKRKAEVADYASRYVKKEHDLQEVVDQRNLKTLTKGTGFIKVLHDPNRGELLEFDEATSMATFQGDLHIYSPSNWDIYPSADSLPGRSLPFLFERLTFTKEEAYARWPDQIRLLEEASKNSKSRSWKRFFSREDVTGTSAEEMIEVYEYWEDRAPVNANKGRFAYCLEGGKILGELMDSPSPEGRIPFDVLTDIDVEDEFWGKSIIEYMESIQNVLNALDKGDLANIEAHQVIRMAIDSEATQLADDVLTDDTRDVVQYKGDLPTFLNTPGTMPDVPRFRATCMEGQKDMAGVTDEMQGRMNRETSGYTFQTAINAGNMIRTRLYNKFARSVKNTYLLALLNIRDKWKIARTIKWLGDENEMLYRDLLGTDLEGGWDLDAEYGNNFSLNPDIAREQIMQMIPLYEKIEGFDWNSLADRVKHGDIGGIEDKYKLAKRRQQEVFNKMILHFEGKGVSAYIEPRENQDHTNMLKYCDYYVMTGEYDKLDEELKTLIDRHVEDRRAVQAKIVAAAQPPAPAAPPQPPGMPPLPGM